MRDILKSTLVLLIITLIAGFLLGFVNDLTSGPIDEREYQAKIVSLSSVIGEEYTIDLEDVLAEDESFDNEEIVINEAYTALDADGNAAGMVMLITTNEGYSDEIKISLGILKSNKRDEAGKIAGIDFLSINETPGLGMNANEPEFIDQFTGKSTDELVVSKNAYQDNEIDAISGATITTDAVTDAVNAGLSFYNSYVEKEDN